MRELSEKDVELILIAQKEYFSLQVTRNVNYRINQLRRLKKAIEKYQSRILCALNKDLGKHRNEAYLCEIGYVYKSIKLMIRNLRRMARPQRKRTPYYMWPSRSYIINEPYGAVLIIAPFNYPFQLLIEPLIGAIAAGNTVVLKTSEYAPYTSKVVKAMIEENFDSNYIACVEGGIDTTTSLLNNSFDYIFFTGSANTGKIVMKAASKRLIPVTLELGGKSPVIVTKSTDIKRAAKRIIWGKLINAGQTCIAPDYVLVYATMKERFIKELVTAIEELYGQNQRESTSYPKIINEKHFNRLNQIIENSKDHIVYGGDVSLKHRFIQPVILDYSANDDIKNAACMKEEIFGPILPVIAYESLNDAINLINLYPKPLALYLFTNEKAVIDKVVLKTSSGGVCINDTISYVINPYLPFGGVGESGMGAYHGIESFNTFSHKKSVVKRSIILFTKLFYPSYNERAYRIARRFYR